MVKHIMIAGHGPMANGGFDPGATGHIKMGEYRYFRDVFFKEMKKYTEGRSDVIYYTNKNVYSYRNLKAIVDYYGGRNNVIIHEMHFDALGNSSASGGHVIIHGHLVPDKIDLGIRDVIKKHIGVRYSHKGHSGISGRYDLYNVNVARNLGINYRLVELGFGTNKKDADMMLGYANEIAKDYVEMMLGIKVKQQKGSDKKEIEKNSKYDLNKYTNDTLADMVLQGNFGNGEERKRALGLRYKDVQGIVDKRVKQVGTPSIDQLAKEVLAGKHGNGMTRRNSLGKNYHAVQKRVNELLGSVKSVDTVAKEVINGKWGNGADRRNRLIANGYDYNKIQKRVNQLLK